MKFAGSASIIAYIMKNMLKETFHYNLFWVLLLTILAIHIQITRAEECKISNLDYDNLMRLTRLIVPDMEEKRKGDAGKVVVIGGSIKYTGAPYFSAITALKVGADLASVITSEEAAQVIKGYSPDLIVIPYNRVDLKSFLSSAHVVVLGPGLGRDDDNLNIAYNVIEVCRSLGKPLVIDADGLYAVYKNISVLKDFPKPGAILTPNHAEANRLIQEIPSSGPWYDYWGSYVSVLAKGEIDQFQSRQHFGWSLEGGGSGRRAGGQGDILAGALGTFFHWALQSKVCEDNNHSLFAQSIAAYAAAKFTRTCNSKAFAINGRSMLASDMIKEIHTAFDDIFLSGSGTVFNVGRQEEKFTSTFPEDKK